MQDHHRAETRQKWARLRFSIVGPLLTAPPASGQLKGALAELAAKSWRHPESGDPVRFGQSTIERWYYAALRADADPIGALQRRPRRDRGSSKAMPAELATELEKQYEHHPSWSYLLHAENLEVLAENLGLDAAPSPSTVRRWMKSKGFLKRKRLTTKNTAGARQAQERFEQREVRSYEVEHVHALWHSDFHAGSRRVLLKEGRYAKVELFAALDDRSRLCCHAQWYLTESAETFVHGLIQSIQKRGVPRSLMTDNGAAMKAAESQAGIDGVGMDWEATLAYSPYQNGKQEFFWNNVEGRLLAMLEGEKELSLELLNEATGAWVEHDYNRRLHSEIGMTPLECAHSNKSVVRPSPTPDALRRAFRRVERRRQRRSDGTISVDNCRFEVPSRFGHIEQLTIRYAKWDLSFVDLYDPDERGDIARLYPLDKTKNAEGRRRTRENFEPAPQPIDPGECGIAPLLRELIEKRRASGLPPAYLPGPGQEQSSDDAADIAGTDDTNGTGHTNGVEGTR